MCVFICCVCHAPSLCAGAFIFSPYKDITVYMNWNTYTISTQVTGSAVAATSAMPSNNKVMSWAFATGECGSENWGGMSASQVAPNAKAWAAAGKQYILSTGGASGVFTCGSDAGFTKFINTYASSGLVGVDFDIEVRRSAV